MPAEKPKLLTARDQVDLTRIAQDAIYGDGFTVFEKAFPEMSDRMKLLSPSTPPEQIDELISGSILEEPNRDLALRSRCTIRTFLEDPQPENPLGGAVINIAVAFGLSNELLQPISPADQNTPIITGSVGAGSELHTNPNQGPHTFEGATLLNKVFLPRENTHQFGDE